MASLRRSFAVMSVLSLPALILGTFSCPKAFNGTIINLTANQPFSRIVVVAHKPDIKVFELGGMTGPEAREVAEQGDSDPLFNLLSESPSVCGLYRNPPGVQIPLFGGDTRNFPFTITNPECKKCDFVISVMSMLINTNDAFWGIDSMPLDADNTLKVTLPALDAGTEGNDELCTSLPGPAEQCVGTGNEILGLETGEGFIHVHRGIQGIGDLTGFEDWRNPVASVELVPMD